MFLRNVGEFLPDYATSDRRPSYYSVINFYHLLITSIAFSGYHSGDCKEYQAIRLLVSLDRTLRWVENAMYSPEFELSTCQTRPRRSTAQLTRFIYFTSIAIFVPPSTFNLFHNRQ
jgi:hypothetical protein